MMETRIKEQCPSSKVPSQKYGHICSQGENYIYTDVSSSLECQSEWNAASNVHHIAVIDEHAKENSQPSVGLLFHSVDFPWFSIGWTPPTTTAEHFHPIVIKFLPLHDPVLSFNTFQLGVSLPVLDKGGTSFSSSGVFLASRTTNLCDGLPYAAIQFQIMGYNILWLLKGYVSASTQGHVSASTQEFCLGEKPQYGRYMALHAHHQHKTIRQHNSLAMLVLAPHYMITVGNQPKEIGKTVTEPIHEAIESYHGCWSYYSSYLEKYIHGTNRN